VVFNVDEAVRSRARTVECWSQTDLAHEIRRTLH
jgi:ribosome-binding protein aMBF1 (putative translation factor)